MSRRLWQRQRLRLRLGHGKRLGQDKRLRGDSLLGTLVSLIIFVMSVALVSKYIMSSSNSMDSIKTQHNMLAVNAYVSGIYEAYTSGQEINLTSSGDMELGDATFLMVFTKESGESKTFGYDSSSEWCLQDGEEVFKADSVSVTEAGGSLFLSLKVKDLSPIEVTMYR